MGKKLLFFVNPKAGHGDIRSVLLEILQIFTQGGFDVTVHPTSGPREITQVISQVGEDYDMVVSIGGDGTLNETVSGLMTLNHPPLLGYIPGGTVNDVAATLSLPKNPLEAAKTIVTGREFVMDIGAFNDRWFTYVAAFGAFTDVSYATPQPDKRILGRLAYLLQGVNRLADIRPIHVRMWIDGQMIEDDVLFGMVASTTSVGGFRLVLCADGAALHAAAVGDKEQVVLGEVDGLHLALVVYREDVYKRQLLYGVLSHFQVSFPLHFAER